MILKKYGVPFTEQKDSSTFEKKVSIFFIEVYLFPNLNFLTLALDILEIYVFSIEPIKNL